jgi:hypothetical protein
VFSRFKWVFVQLADQPHGTVMSHAKFESEDVKIRNLLGDLRVDESIILERILRKYELD